MEVFVALLLATGSALLVELIFRLIKSADDPKSVLTYAPVNYLPVSAVLSRPHIRWASFIAFRAIPPALIMLLLAAILNKYLPNLPLYPYTVLVAVLSSATRSGYLLFARRSIPAERWIHLFCILLTLGIALLVAALDKNPYLAKLAPNLSGLIDNLWSSLFAALIVVLYIDSTKLTRNSGPTRRHQPSTYVVHWFDKLHVLHGQRISEKAEGDFLLKLLLYSILIVENYNRPLWIRKLENLLVRLPHTELTVGIAQVRSRRHLTDAESIDRAIAIIRTSMTEHESHKKLSGVPSPPTEVLNDYNPSGEYQKMVTDVFFDLVRLRPSAFGIAHPY
jgi:hypothetical protein